MARSSLQKLAGWWLIGCLSGLGSAPAHARDVLDYFNETPAPFVAPGRLFSAEVPRHWLRTETTSDNRVTFQVGRDAMLWVWVRPVAEGANPRQLALNAVENRLRRRPGFEVVARRDVKLAGHSAAEVLGRYAYQGNIQYPRTLEEIYLVIGAEAFVLHFECSEPLAPRYSDQLNRFYESFEPRPQSFTPSADSEAEPGMGTHPHPIDGEDFPFHPVVPF